MAATPQSQSQVIPLDVNGVRRAVTTDPTRSLLSVLRDDLGLTGAKYGCGEAQCGACVVLLDGQPVPACVTPLADAAGKRLATVEGLSHNGRLSPVQQAFVDEGALQCGYCTPGMIMAATALLRQNPRPTDGDISSFMQSHICRCAVYGRILAAVHRAAGQAGESEAGS